METGWSGGRSVGRGAGPLLMSLAVMGASVDSLLVGKRLVGDAVVVRRGSGGRSWLSWLEALGNQVEGLFVQWST